MNARRRAGTFRLTHPATVAVLALVTQGGTAAAQAAGGGVSATRVTATGQRDSARRATEITLVRKATPRIDSLARRLNALPIGSAEYRATEDSLHAAFLEVPRSTALGRSGTFTVRVLPSRAPLAFSTLDVVPQGSLGFVTDGVNRASVEPAGAIVEYFEYPTVVSVDGNSPASRAGVGVGDLVIAFDGRDVRRNAVNLTRLLTPGREVSVRLRRADGQRDVLIEVEKASPEVLAARRADALRASITTPRARLIVDSIERRIVEEERAAGMAATAVGGRTVAARPGARGSGGIIAGRAMAPSLMPATAGVLGAAVTSVDADLANSLVGMKGKRGVLVTAVPEGSPADRAGLKRGDVILRVESSDVATTSQLLLRLHLARSNRVEKIRLLVLRAGETQELLLDGTR